MAKKKTSVEAVNPEYDIDSLDKKQFELIKERDEKIYDKKFESKPIGYFKDAMIRFSKNKTNVIASVILGILIILAIFVPMLTSKNITRLESQLAHLPPRMPIVEKLGFLDGRSNVSEQHVDRSTIGTIDGYEHLGIPANFNIKYIDLDTLENTQAPCFSTSSERCRGGSVRLTSREEDLDAVLRAQSTFLYDPALDLRITVDLSDVDTVLNVYLEDALGERLLLDGLTNDGQHTFILADHLDAEVASYRLVFELESDTPGNSVTFHSVTLNDEADDSIIFEREGLSFINQYRVQDSSGGFDRLDATTLIASFKFLAYERAFDVRTHANYAKDDVYALMEENEGVCGAVEDYDKFDGKLVERNSGNPLVLPEGCPVVRINNVSLEYTDSGNTYYDYNVDLDYAAMNGYDSVPYFFFGTTNSGADLFAITWLGLRTSLLIGLTVAVINITIGIIYGSISGYYGGKVDLIMERFSEVIGRIPWLVLLSIFYALIGPGALTLILILIVSGWIGVASVTRTQFYRYKGREYVLASRTLGAKDSRLIFRHILPNGIGTIITASILMIPAVIFTEAALSYLGFGIGHGQSFKLFGFIDLSGVSIGVLLADGQNEMMDKPYLTIFPAIIISILMITFNMFGNALRDAFNPSLRGSE